ncbi:conserved Plasmodium protein, unknown function [Plasmodium gallinaceum]|uniref:Uncharacterized protein n=1 Tax=Plasmodium gallinaceum TaxID=5849 RepID=A0A1J1GXE7_PLAGA|nr:conserved Plasmodium protein, unknown function [Plasmodium gallinaceum]CRG95965.1 conserved Plasmodium protein, unknown function [Plasmodium gallinaceum]
MNRERLEKERLLQRNEKHIKNIVVDNIIADEKCKNNDNTYLRKKDAEYNDFKCKEKQKLKEYIKIENRRKENLDRDENRWKKVELSVQNEIDKTKKLQQMSFKSEKNKSKCSHDIINHEFINYEESMKLEKKKNACILNRRKFLSEVNGSHNPITAIHN